MSDSDSFINEVTEEVRRDQLYGYLRRYGWIAVVLIVVLVGGAAWNEYNKAQATAKAQATGDALMNALSQNDPEFRMAAVAEVEAEGSAVAVTALITAASQQEAGDTAAAVATLQDLTVNTDVPVIYNELAAFKAALLEPDPATRRTSLEAMAQPGLPFALLAQEQLALADLAAGDPDAAITRLTAIVEDAGVPRGLLVRAQTLMVALGAELPGLATLQ
ncbi:tetratricopeptide repeat protein [Yoonia sp. R2331]|uniref:tetratricopeptide repeat protein n=1 Tax=Yoonia sp. R2331 TaxID=3237238 RepID=UPI0034E37D1C